MPFGGVGFPANVKTTQSTSSAAQDHIFEAAEQPFVSIELIRGRSTTSGVYSTLESRTYIYIYIYFISLGHPGLPWEKNGVTYQRISTSIQVSVQEATWATRDAHLPIFSSASQTHEVGTTFLAQPGIFFAAASVRGQTTKKSLRVPPSES